MNPCQLGQILLRLIYRLPKPGPDGRNRIILSPLELIGRIAAAITTGMTAEQLAYLDLAYAPPFSPVWDPVQTAARTLS